MGGNTFKSVLDANKGVGPGFDLLRILLAVAIFYGHAKWASGHAADYALTLMPDARMAEYGWEGWKRPIQYSFVPAFFALSGFLVTGSALRTQVTSTFLAFRALRIFPALIVEITLSAILLGLFVTTLPLGQYFTDPQLYRYLLNISGHFITFELPGVFETLPAKGIVNANLWTLPAEFECYFVTAALMMSGLLYRRAVMTWLFAVVTVVFAAMNLFGDFAVTPTTAHPIAVVYYFFVGVMAFHWREKIPMSWPLFLGAGAIGYFLLLGHHAVFIAAPFVTYCTLFFGMLAVPKIKLISSGDYSYGIYLYGFPITQAVVELVPGMKGNGWGVFFLSLALTMVFAAFSWHVIEKRCLAMKKHLPAKWFPKQRPMPVTPGARAAETA